MRTGLCVFFWSAALVLLSGCAHSPLRRGADKGEIIEAEGWSAIEPKDPLGTRQRALAEAQKKAVEKALGVSVAARTRVEAAISVEQKIEANIGGFIRRYEILSERSEEGFLKIRIRALVSSEPPQAPPRLPRKERIAVMVSDLNLSAGIRKALAAKGFSVSAQARGADVVVNGSVEAYAVADPRLSGFQSYRARATVEAAETKTAKVSSATFESSALDTVAAIARSQAVENAGLAAGEALAAELVY